MPIEETIEQKGQEALAAVGKTGGKVFLKASKAIVVWLLANGWNLVAGKVKEHHETGQISERQLQLKGEDVHIATLPQEALKQVGHHLRKNGIDYAIEKNDDGTFNLMFQGKDNDHIDYLVTKAFNECGIDPATIPNGKVEGINIEEDTPTQDTPEHDQAAERDAGDEAFDQPDKTTQDTSEHDQNEPERTAERSADDAPTTRDEARADAPSQPTRAQSKTAKTETKSAGQQSTPAQDRPKPSAKKTRKDLLAKYRKETAKNLDAAHKARSQTRSRPQPTRTTPKTNNR